MTPWSDVNCIARQWYELHITALRGANGRSLDVKADVPGDVAGLTRFGDLYYVDRPPQLARLPVLSALNIRTGQCPSRSPIPFPRIVDGNSDVAGADVMDADYASADVVDAEVAPDGTRIAWLAYTNSTSQHSGVLKLINDVWEVTTGRRRTHNSWLTLYISSIESSIPTEIYRTSVPERSILSAATHSDSETHSLRWSPDCHSLAFLAECDGNAASLRIVPL